MWLILIFGVIFLYINEQQLLSVESRVFINCQKFMIYQITSIYPPKQAIRFEIIQIILIIKI
ncbi:unnamed protein product [Paramecium octaurelia]|uniref:Uncharacterized protein n=1 Tax=Paramecium octaurelia TaxID=43137 RepID=A0A8S1SAQ9_PAROT|nr:unnamed protein product [Paramecium octaurelia]